jgi:uncharacterized protein YndB with AHSA1/START domain
MRRTEACIRAELKIDDHARFREGEEMMQRRRSLLLGIALVFVAAIGWMVWQPPSFGVTTSQVTLSKTDVNAPAEKLFALIEDFHNWAKWSPHEHDNPAVRRTYSGAAEGKGAIYEWDGDKDFGAGRAQIAEADAPTKLLVDLDLTRPVQGHLRVDFTLQRNGATTNIAMSTNGPDDLVKYVTNNFFDTTLGLMPLSCAADGSPKPLCDVITKVMSLKYKHS